MPFAPVTLEEYATKCYKNFKGAEHPAQFMTICFDCTDFMKKNSPATVHVDGTARPQTINKATNPSYYKIVNEYRKITKIPSIINTSFNMHEEPIVCTPADAIRSFKLGHLDYLAIGNFLVKNQ
jgi:carbamoyltransferase